MTPPIPDTPSLPAPKRTRGFTPERAALARQIRQHKEHAIAAATPTLDPADIHDLLTVPPREFKTLSEPEKDKLLLAIRDQLLLTCGQEMLRKVLIAREKLTTQDTIPYGTLWDKRYKDKETGSAGLKAPQFFVNSLQVAILQAPGTTISSVQGAADGAKSYPQVEKTTGCEES